MEYKIIAGTFIFATGPYRGGSFNDPCLCLEFLFHYNSPRARKLESLALEAKSIAYIHEDRDLQALAGAVLVPMPVTLVP